LADKVVPKQELGNQESNQESLCEKPFCHLERHFVILSEAKDLAFGDSSVAPLPQNDSYGTFAEVSIFVSHETNHLINFLILQIFLTENRKPSCGPAGRSPNKKPRAGRRRGAGLLPV